MSSYTRDENIRYFGAAGKKCFALMNEFPDPLIGSIPRARRSVGGVGLRVAVPATKNVQSRVRRPPRVTNRQFGLSRGEARHSFPGVIILVRSPYG